MINLDDDSIRNHYTKANKHNMSLGACMRARRLRDLRRSQGIQFHGCHPLIAVCNTIDRSFANHDAIDAKMRGLGGFSLAIFVIGFVLVSSSVWWMFYCLCYMDFGWEVVAWVRDLELICHCFFLKGLDMPLLHLMLHMDATYFAKPIARF